MTSNHYPAQTKPPGRAPGGEQALNSATDVASKAVPFEYKHKKSGRKVSADVFPFHNWAFQEGLLHAENLGGDIDLVLGQRCLIGAFPWRYEGLESCPCRILAFLDLGDMPIEAVGAAAKADMM